MTLSTGFYKDSIPAVPGCRNPFFVVDRGRACCPRRQRSQHAVDEARGAFGAERFCQLDRFIDGNLERRGAVDSHFKNGHAQDVAVDECNLLQRPFRCVAVDDGVQFFFVLQHAFNQPVRGQTQLRLLAVGGQVLGQHILHGVTRRIQLIQDLQRDTARDVSVVLV